MHLFPSSLYRFPSSALPALTLQKAYTRVIHKALKLKSFPQLSCCNHYGMVCISKLTAISKHCLLKLLLTCKLHNYSHIPFVLYPGLHPGFWLKLTASSQFKITGMAHDSHSLMARIVWSRTPIDKFMMAMHSWWPYRWYPSFRPLYRSTMHLDSYVKIFCYQYFLNWDISTFHRISLGTLVSIYVLEGCRLHMHVHAESWNYSEKPVHSTLKGL